MSQLGKLMKSLGIDVALEPKLLAFVTLFEKWNKQINLSAARTPQELIEHVKDSLHVVPPLRGKLQVLDVGSGGGFPAAVVAICLPETTVVALEPVHKKQAFLRTVARELAPNLDARAERLEEHLVRDYEAACSRATMDLREWLERAITYVRLGGVAIGFEAQRRDDLPPGTERHTYASDGKERALVILERT